MMMQMPRVLPADALVGRSVTNSDGENLGKVEALAVDVEGGRIAYAVLSFGGFLSLGQKLLAIPWEAMKISLHDEKFILQVPEERLKDAEGFQKTDWPDMADREWAEEVYRYYGYDPYWVNARVVS